MLTRKDLIIISVISVFIITLTCFLENGHSMTFGSCVSECQTDVMYVSDCMQDEQNYWDADISKRDLKQACIELIRNERIDCYSICGKQEAQNNSAAFVYEFYDTQIQFFPSSSSF